jgi:UDP-N-acetylmuramoylalanine--D-glutamate ligase
MADRAERRVNLPGRVLVVGLGRTGSAAALALAERSVEVVAADSDPNVDTGRLAAAGVEVHRGTEEEALLDGVELMVKGPGVRSASPLPAAARARGIPIWSEAELGYRLLPGNPIVGITGTKGKTTVTRLLGAMFDAAGRPAMLAGNEHVPLSEVAASIERGTWIVCELSSFALADVDTFSCDVAVLLNLEPDHLDHHGTFDAYRDAKLRIFERAAAKVVPRDFGADGVEFAADDPLPAEPRMPGEHNRANAAAATAAARAVGIDDDAIAEALRSFPGVEHRLELVAEIDGVRYVNDSKATNTTAARRGIAAYASEPLHLILGGSLKGESFDELASSLPRTVKSIDLIGQATGELAAALDRAGHTYRTSKTLPAAVAAAARDSVPGDVVLLSPACASFDQYRNFEERGDDFRRQVEALR